MSNIILIIFQRVPRGYRFYHKWMRPFCQTLTPNNLTQIYLDLPIFITTGFFQIINMFSHILSLESCSEFLKNSNLWRAILFRNTYLFFVFFMNDCGFSKILSVVAYKIILIYFQNKTLHCLLIHIETWSNSFYFQTTETFVGVKYESWQTLLKMLISCHLGLLKVA